MEASFNIHAGKLFFENPVVLSAMAGVTDAAFALAHAKGAGLVILGAYNLDEAAVSAAKEAAARGRTEFIFENPLEKISEEIDGYRADTRLSDAEKGEIAISVRSAAIEPLVKAAQLLKEKKAIMELDLHCRQPEFTKRGMGQGLLENPERMIRTIESIKETGVVLSVKVRAGIIPAEKLVSALDALGADIIHIDAMAEGAGADLNAIADSRGATSKIIIANNSVTSFDGAKEFFGRGADMVSVARAAADPRLIPELVRKSKILQEETGWYNSPSHICKGGDNRGLAFCCPPVKHCTLRRKLEDIGVDPQAFVTLKLNLIRGTPLEYGDTTCFGSLAWCCKASKPCYSRDMALDEAGITPAEYMRYKKAVADGILKALAEKKSQAAFSKPQPL